MGSQTDGSKGANHVDERIKGLLPLGSELSRDGVAAVTKQVWNTSAGDWRGSERLPTQPLWSVLPTMPESVRQARRFAVDALAEVADPGHVDDVVLVVSELVTNAVREVAKLDLGASVRLGIAVSPRWTHLYAVDPASTLSRHAPRGPLAGSGRGIPIIESLAAMTWIDQGERDKTIHVVLTRTGVELTAQEQQALLPQPDDDALLRPSEVAEMFGVRTPTIARWAREGRLMPMFTPGAGSGFRRRGARVQRDDLDESLDVDEGEHVGEFVAPVIAAPEQHPPPRHAVPRPGTVPMVEKDDLHAPPVRVDHPPVHRPQRT